MLSRSRADWWLLAKAKQGRDQVDAGSQGEEAPRFFPLGAQQVAEKEIVETWRTTRARAEMRIIMACSLQR